MTVLLVPPASRLAVSLKVTSISILSFAFTSAKLDGELENSAWVSTNPDVVALERPSLKVPLGEPVVIVSTAVLVEATS